MKIPVKTILFFVLVFAALFALQYSPETFGDPDGFYHVKVAELLGQGEILHSFKWLTVSTWEHRFADQHFLYHLLLIPFIHFHPIIGAQVLNALLVTAVAVIFFLILKHLQVTHKYFWTIAFLFFSQGFLMRMLFIKAVPLGLLLMFLSLFFLLQRKPMALFFSSLLFILSYGGFIFVSVLLVVQTVASFLTKNKPCYQEFIFSLLGLGAGLLLHPGQDSLLYHMYNQVFRAGLGYVVPVGGEWGSPKILDFLSGNILILLLWLTGLVVLIEQWKKKLGLKNLIFLALTSGFFFLLTTKSQRFIEYWVPFAVLFSAASLKEVVIFKTWIERFRKKMKNGFLSTTPVILAFSCLGLVLVYTTLRTSDIARHNVRITDYKKPMEALKNSSSENSIVFNTRWDHFPMLFYLNSHNRYITGMDPMFTYSENPDKYWLWYHISNDESFTCSTRECLNQKEILASIQEDFDAEYIFLENTDSPNLKNYLEENSRVKKIYADDFSSVYEILK